MKAVGFTQSHPLDHPQSLLDLDLPAPEPGAHDMLVEIRAVSVNPVDCWIRRSARPEIGEPLVLGMDAAGIVRQTGASVRLFKRGDRVWYSGSFQRQGSSGELHAVDERLVARMPETMDFAPAAALPLTAITAWELLFERMDIARHDTGSSASAGGCLLVSGAAGGVGSVLTQLARALSNLTVIGTASRAESAAWVKSMGAHHIVDHNKPLLPQLAALDIPQVDFVASLTNTDRNLSQLIEVMKPRGHFGLIDASGVMDLRQFMAKNLSVHYEDMGMTTKSGPADEYVRHHQILERITRLVDAGVLRSTMTTHLGAINAANMRRAHAIIESGRSLGKIVLENNRVDSCA